MGNAASTTLSAAGQGQMALDGPHMQLPNLPHSHSEPSKLCQLRARYQQRLLAEKEQRLLQLYAEQRAQQERAFQRVGYPAAAAHPAHPAHRGSAGSSSSNTSQSSQSSLQCGKVRQLFEGRRQVYGHGQQGRDRGQPLAPLERRARAPVLATRSNSNVNLSHSYHFGQSRQIRQPRGHSLDRALRQRQGDWAAHGRHHLEYASDDSSESGSESPPPHARPLARSFAHYPRFQEDLHDFRILNRLPNVGGSLYSQTNMAPPGRLSASGPAHSTAATRRAANENAPPAAAPAASTRPAATSRLPGPARKTVAPAAPVAAPAAARKVPLRPSSGQRSAGAAGAAGAAAAPVKPAGLPQPARTPAAATTRAPPQTNGVSKTSPARPATKVPASPQRMSAARAGAAGAAGAAHTPRAAQSTQDDGLVPCSLCGRRFASDRVSKHQEICARSRQKKRKTFDPVAARVKGTEAEKYVRRAKNAPEPTAMKNSNWRRKHEDFIQTIRAAKQVQTHIAKGGKLSDLPPPPPSDYSDYVPCPHCGRKFNQTAADRHIPKCATMLHNKPKSGSASKPAIGRGAVTRR